jgi:group I intron endonuclease
MKSGIYMIKNEINGKFYIGSTKNINMRFSTHKSKLKHNKHDNIHLQRSYNKYGDVFSYIILENVEVEKLLEIEQTYLDKYNDDELFYNIAMESSGGDNISNHPNREEIIKKMKKSLLERYENMPVEKRKKLSENVLGNKNPNYGNNWTDEMRQKASERTTEYFRENEHYKQDKTFEEIYGDDLGKEMRENLSKHAKTRTGEKNPFYGKHHSEETKEILRKKRVGKYHGIQNIPFYIDGILYQSLGEASKKLDIHITTIRHRLNSPNKKFVNYVYEQPNENIL